MKCPKCGYVGFAESTQCRHCGYDFSFSSVDVVDALTEPMPAPVVAEGLAEVRLGVAGDDTSPAADRLGFVDLQDLDDGAERPLADLPLVTPLPSDLFANSPPPARPPLAVRRGTDRPRSRPTTQVMRRTATSLLDVPLPEPPTATVAGEVAGPPGAASIGARAIAGLVDVLLLAGIGLAVVYLTLRLSGLTTSQADILPPVPLGAFLLGLSVAYLAAFTAYGGQTLGKMAVGLRVVGEDGAVPPGAAALRAVAALAGASLAGLGFLPALFDGDHRALHDRVAGTRVVRA